MTRRRGTVIEASAAGSGGAEAGRRPDFAQAELRQLVRELEAHQIELETQNEELRAARLDIEAGLARYLELFDSAPIGYVVVSPEGSVRAINLAGARMLAVERKALVGGQFLACVEPRHQAEFRAFLQRTLARQGRDAANEVCELKLLARGREPFDVRLTAAMVDSRMADAMIAIEDVTAQKRAEVALHGEIARRDEFMAVLSHELRNPLSPIRSSLCLLDQIEPGSEQGRRALAIIDRQVDHLTRIVDDLLDVARIAHGKIALQREPVDLAQIVRRTLDDQRPAFEAAGVALEASWELERAWVCADSTRINQVFGNLLTNALKFTPRGGKVAVELFRDGDRAALSVRDTGAGIEPSMCDHLFEPFVQGPQTLDRTRGGLGLGLAMVKGLMQLHGGTAEAVSPGIDRGARFTVRLPLIPEPAAAVVPAPLAAERVQRVLVIEDNRDSAEGLCALLALQGHEVQAAFDGLSGIELARQTAPDVVLCDIGLPGMDGYEIARAFRADQALKHTYMVALSGYARPEDRKLAADAGFDSHIAKPPSLQQLRELTRPRALLAEPS